MGKTVWTGRRRHRKHPAMPHTRRVLLASLIATPALASAERRLVPRPGAAPVPYRARLLTPPTARPVLLVSLGDAEFRLPSWYGQAGIETRLRAAGRDVLLVGFEGITGTGVRQRLGALLGFDNAGAPRVLGIETLAALDAQISTEQRETQGHLVSTEAGLRLTMRQRTITRGRASSLEWRTGFTWTGDGIPQAAPTPAGAPEPRLRIDAARAAIAGWLALAPRMDLTQAPFEEAGLYAAGLIAAP